VFGDLSPEKIIVLGFIALIVLGPNRLPQAARSLGRIMGQLRAMSSSVETEVRHALHDPSDALSAAVSEFRPGQIRRSVRGVIASTLTPPAAATPSTLTPAAPATPSPPAVPSALGFEELGGPGAPDDPSLN
jgi:sec-independent protein translocase protein TatB